MKTTIEITDDLAIKAKKFAARHGLTLRAIIEDGLRMLLSSEAQQAAFQLRDASVNGRGLQPEFRDQEWSTLRRAAYEGRGG